MRYPTYYISNHSLQRFRQWTGDAFVSRSDEDLIELIDSAIIRATKEKRFEPIVDRGKPLRLYNMEELIPDAKVYALVGANLPEFQDRHREAILSFLTPENVGRSRTNGRWDLPFNGLGEKLAGVVPFVPAPSPPVVNNVETAGANLARAMLVRKNQKEQVEELERQLHDAKQDLKKSEEDVARLQVQLEETVASA